MSAIPLRDRWFPTEHEFLALIARYSIQVYRTGNYFFFVGPGSPRAGRVDGTLVSPQDCVRFVRDWLYRGDPILMYVASKSRPSRVGIAWTQAGRGWLNAQRQAGASVRSQTVRARIRKAGTKTSA